MSFKSVVTPISVGFCQVVDHTSASPPRCGQRTIRFEPMQPIKREGIKNFRGERRRYNTALQPVPYTFGEPDNTTRRKTRTTRTRRPRPRRPSDQHVGASRRLGTACEGCRKRISSGNNLCVPAPFNWATPHPKFQAPVTSRLVPET